jgi:hypothetical protein
MNVFLSDNAAMLRQGARLLSSIDDADYLRRMKDCFNSNIGGHVRHAIEHYICFLDGRASGDVDYDSRRRDELIEGDRETAREALQVLAERMEALDPLDPDVLIRVRLDTGSAVEWTRSSVGRELQFLLSHTVHHYALVAVLCQMQGIATEPQFGVAPSTLHARAQSVRE